MKTHISYLLALATCLLIFTGGHAQVCQKPSLNYFPDMTLSTPSSSMAISERGQNINLRLINLGSSLLQDSIENRASFRWHRVMGFSILAGTAGSAVTGTLVLNKYSSNELPSDGLLYTHRALGISTGILAITNTVTGFVNFNKLKNEQAGLKKRKTHRFLSTCAFAGIATAAAFGVMATSEYGNTGSPQEVTVANTHRFIALASTGVTIISVAIIIW